MLKKQGFLDITYRMDESGYCKRHIKPKCEDDVTKMRRAPSQNCETPINKNVNHNRKKEKDKNNISYESKFKPTID